MVERPAPPHIRHRGAADLRRADARRGVVRAGRPDRRLHRAERAGLRRGTAARTAGPARDRGEPVARDPLRNGRSYDRLRPGGGAADAGRGRAPDRVDGPRPRVTGARGDPSGAERRPEGAPGARRRRFRRRGLSGGGCRDEAHLRTGRGIDEVNDEQHQERQPTEEELRQRIEQQLREVRVQDLLLESAVSLINLSARRIAKEDERDLEQARVGIEAVRAVVGLLDDEPAKQVQSALSGMQMLYVKHAGVETEPEAGGEGPPQGAEVPPREPTEGRPPRLWTPPGSTPPR